MNLNIDSNKVEENIKILNNLISNYEENINDLFYEIKKIDSLWFGADKDEFLKVMNQEELNCIELVNRLKKINCFFSYASKKYDNLIFNISSKFN